MNAHVDRAVKKTGYKHGTPGPPCFGIPTVRLRERTCGRRGKAKRRLIPTSTLQWCTFDRRDDLGSWFDSRTGKSPDLTRKLQWRTLKKRIDGQVRRLTCLDGRKRHTQSDTSTPFVPGRHSKFVPQKFRG